VVAGQIRLNERSWGIGTTPTLTFSVGAGLRGQKQVDAFLYYSHDPDPLATHQFPPELVGQIRVPGSAIFDIHVPPQRSLVITEFTREVFIQGELRDQDTGESLAVTNETYLDIVYDDEPDVLLIDFESEDDSETLLVNGQTISTPPEFGNLLGIDALEPAANSGPAIFDSTPGGPNANSLDRDLLVDLGNLLILQELDVESVPGFFAKPNDAAAGGTLVFDFALSDVPRVEPLSIDLIDIDSENPAAHEQRTSVTVTLTDVLGHQRVFTVPQGWSEDRTRFATSGYRTLDLTTLDPQPGFLPTATATATEHPEYVPAEVVHMEIELEREGAVDNLLFAHEADPGGRTGGKGKKVLGLPGASRTRAASVR
jgi:hypothetical protein